MEELLDSYWLRLLYSLSIMSFSSEFYFFRVLFSEEMSC